MRKLIVFVAAGALAITGLVAAALGTFRGSNGRLLYQEIVGEHEQLFTVKPDGSDVRQLTDFPDSDATDAAWSPTRPSRLRAAMGRTRAASTR